MTCREKLKIDHPDCWEALMAHCPRDFGYLDPELTLCYTLDCDACWSLPLHYQDRVLYLCDRKQCINCTYPTCKHTQDISHAVNFKRQEDATDPRRTPYFWYETSEDDVEVSNQEEKGERRMTCREKLKLEHPDCVVNECDLHDDESYLDYAGGCVGCPSDYGYLDTPNWCSVFHCERCWDREIPNNSPEHDQFRPLGESIVKGFQSTKDHVYRIADASCREDPSILFAKIVDSLYRHHHGNVILRYKPKDGTIEAVPMIIDEELDK